MKLANHADRAAPLSKKSCNLKNHTRATIAKCLEV